MDLHDTTAAIRHFTREYTRRLGVIRDQPYGEDLSLTEARVLFELAQQDGISQATLGRLLGLDKGYVSRIVRSFVRRGLIAGSLPGQGRTRLLKLTETGRLLFDRINSRSAREVTALVSPLTEPQRRQLTDAMATIKRLLMPADGLPEIVIRPHGIGDIGWIIHRHAILYAWEYGWNIDFEQAVARIGANFLKNFDPATDQCLVAERGGQIVGSATVVRLDAATAKLRIVYVEPEMRGSGLGRRLVEGCIAFAREAGYHRMVLWTNDVLTPARKLYERLGFRLTASEPHHSFGVDLVGETWERDL